MGDQAYVRERASLGDETVSGRASTAVDNDVEVGARVGSGERDLTAFSVIEDDVFVAPGVITTNDHTMARHSAGRPLTGAVLRRACRVGRRRRCPARGGGGGRLAFVAAGAVVTRGVSPRTVVMGVPGEGGGDVPDQDLLEDPG